MLNNQEFINLERRLWREGNPLADELASTRDELMYFLKEAEAVLEKYSPVLAKIADVDDIAFYEEWDSFGDMIDNLKHDLGVTE
jgi:hypothetical protein